jgi:NAD+ synthase
MLRRRSRDASRCACRPRRIRQPFDERHEARLTSSTDREVIADANSSRDAQTLEYHHADRLDYAVVGDPNRLEYDQG